MTLNINLDLLKNKAEKIEAFYENISASVEKNKITYLLLKLKNSTYLFDHKDNPQKLKEGFMSWRENVKYKNEDLNAYNIFHSYIYYNNLKNYNDFSQTLKTETGYSFVDYVELYLRFIYKPFLSEKINDPKDLSFLKIKATKNNLSTKLLKLIEKEFNSQNHKILSLFIGKNPDKILTDKFNAYQMFNVNFNEIESDPKYKKNFADNQFKELLYKIIPSNRLPYLEDDYVGQEYFIGGKNIEYLTRSCPDALKQIYYDFLRQDYENYELKDFIDFSSYKEIQGIYFLSYELASSQNKKVLKQTLQFCNEHLSVLIQQEDKNNQNKSGAINDFIKVYLEKQKLVKGISKATANDLNAQDNKSVFKI